MSLVTKGMGTNRLITQGGGYSFSWGGYALSVGAGGGGNSGTASLWIGPRTERSRHQPAYAARRPRRGRQVPIVLPYSDNAFTDFEFLPEITLAGEIVEQPVDTSPAISAPVVPILTQAVPETKRMSSKAKVAIVIAISVALVTVGYFWRRRNRQRMQRAISVKALNRRRRTG